MGELDAGDRALRGDEAGDGGPRLRVRVGPDAGVVGADPALGLTAVASAITSPAPPTARLPRCTRCQSVGRPSRAEYWHIGETAMRLRSVTSRSRSGVKSALIGGQLLGGHEAGLDVDRHVLQPVEDPLRLGADDGQALEERLRLRVAALRLERHELAGEGGDRRLHLRRVDGEGAVGGHPEGARVEEVVELEGLPLAVGLVDAEADRAEGRGEEGRVHRPLERAVEDALVDQLLQRPQARDVGLRLLDRAVGVLELEAHGGLPAADLDVAGPRPCMSSCIRMWVKKASKSTFGWSAGASATFEMGTSTFSNFACCAFFSITRLVPFSATTRSSFGRLKAAVCTPLLPSPEEKTTFTTRIGAMPPSFGLRSAGSIGRRSSSHCSSRGEARELRRLLVVAHGDEGLEGGLVVEPAVLVDLVGADGGLERRVELHPGHVARVVVVARGRRRRASRGSLQRRLRGRRRGLAQQRGGARELALVLDAVGHGHELSRPACAGWW